MNLLSKYLLFCQVGFHDVLAVMVGITLNVKSVILLSWLPVYWFNVARSQTMITFTSGRILILLFNLWDKIYVFLSFYGSGLVIILKKNLPERKGTILLLSIEFWNFRKKKFLLSQFLRWTWKPSKQASLTISISILRQGVENLSAGRSRFLYLLFGSVIHI